MSKQKWIVPMVAGMLSLSLVGCGNTEMGTRAEVADAGTSMLGTTIAPPHSSQEHSSLRTSYSTGEQMVDNGRYYADSDGAMSEDRETTQKDCKNCPRERRVMDDVERAMRDVGRTMESTRTDM